MRSLYLLFVILFIFCSTPTFLKLTFKINESNISSSKTIPTAARVLYLILCENQVEVDEYVKAFPSITADVMFLCWKENCFDTNFQKLPKVNTAKWSGSTSNFKSFVRLDWAFDYIEIQPRNFIINENELNLKRRTTWTTARNLIFERASQEERRQGWRWAYYTFVDGDIDTECKIIDNVLQSNHSDGDEAIFATRFRELVKIEEHMDIRLKKHKCYMFFDTFLLSVSPAIGTIAGMGTPVIFDGLHAQIVYHIDGMFNAFHRDALPFLLPYCPRYDEHSWWSSQAILVYRSLCFYGHAIQFNPILVKKQKHRKYPRTQDPWTLIDSDMNLVPLSLTKLQLYMKQTRIVSPIILGHYRGWSLELISDECQKHHVYVDPKNCKVSGNLNKTFIP